MKWLYFAWKNVFRNKRRTLITLILASIGTAAVLMASGFALYTYDSLKQMAARESGHVVLANGDYFDKDEETPLQYGLSNSQSLIDHLLDDPRVSMVLPRLSFSGLISNGEKSAIYIGKGVDPKGEFIINGALTQLEQGRAIRHGKPSEIPEVMLGKDLAKSLKAEPGDTLTLLATTADGILNALDVQVVGTYATGVPDYDARALMTDIATAQELLVSNRVSTLSVYLFDLESAASFRDELAALWPEQSYKLWSDLAYFYHSVHQLYDRIFGMLGMIIVVMVFFAITNAVSTSVVERTREIGTLAALGTTPARLIQSFAMEAGIIGTLAALIGAAIAAGVTLLLYVVPVMMPPPPGRSVGYPLYLYFDPWVYIQVVLLIIAISILAAWITARRGANIPIVEALQHV
jgi:putative ABC transport system permease protein